MKMTSEVLEAWDNREGPVILATIDENSSPNIIYATCVSRYGDDRIIIADNYFDKTRKNILAGTKGAVLFMDKNSKAYQAKGRIEYHTEGDLFDDMKSWNPEKHPGNAAAVLVVEEVYSGAAKLC